MCKRLNNQLLLLTDVVLDSNILERRQDAARTLAILSVEGPIQRYSDGSNSLLHWTKPLTKNGGKIYVTLNGYPVKNIY